MAGRDHDLALVTVSFDSAQALQGLLRSLPAAARVRPEVVIVENGEDAGGRVRELAAQEGARYLHLPRNPGYGGAINQAVEGLPDSVSWILVTNPDVTFGAAAVDTLLERARGEATAGAVGPLIRDAAGNPYPSARRVPSVVAGSGHALLGRVWPGNPWTRRYRQDSRTDSLRDAGWLSGACVLIRREAFQAVAGFDAGYFMYFEDLDLGWRLGLAGWRNVFDPAAEVTHTGAHSTGHHSDRMIRAHHQSARRFLRKRYPRVWQAPLRAALSVGLRMREAGELRRGA